MRSTILPLVLAASLAAAGVANAAETMGVVKSIDVDHNAVTLEDGSVYTFVKSSAEKFPLTGFRAGDHVKITWSERNGTDRVGEAISTVDS